MKFNETKWSSVKFGLPRAQNVEVPLLRHVTACSLADRYGGYVICVSFVSRLMKRVFCSEILEGPN